MRSPDYSKEAILADLDIELISALYRAAGEADEFDTLVQTLQTRFAPEGPASTEPTPERVSRQLDRIQTLIEGQGTAISRDPLERAVEEVPTAALVIDPFGRVLLANEIGEALFDLKPGQQFDETVIEPAYRQQFSAFVSSARLKGNQHRLIVRIDADALPGDENSRSPISVAEAIIVNSPRRDHGCIALRTLEIPWSDGLDSQLREAFGLSDAECAIARQFFELRDPVRVADARGTSPATVQTQLKAVFSKMQVGGRAELLQLLAMLAARAASHPSSRLAEWSNPLGRESFFVRSDGSRIAYSWQGAEDGKPVLVVHGQSLAHIFPPEADRLYRAADLKLFILSRPGFGHSEFDPGLKAIDDHALAICEFCEQQGISGIPALTVSSGLVGLSRALEIEPGLFSSIANVGYLWNSEVPITRRLPTQQRVIFHLARYMPKLLKTIVSIAYRNIKRVGVDWYIERLLGGQQVDVEYFRSGRNSGLIRSAAGHMLIQGPEIFCRELEQPQEPWATPLRQSGIPLLFALAEHDSVHSPSEYAAALALGDQARFELLGDCGELYFYKAAEDIAQIAIRHFSDTAPGYQHSFALLSATAPSVQEARKIRNL